MTDVSPDLTIEEALADPVIGAAMRADRVDPHGFERLLRCTAWRLEDRRQAQVTPRLPAGCIAALAGGAGPRATGMPSW